MLLQKLRKNTDEIKPPQSIWTATLHVEKHMIPIGQEHNPNLGIFTSELDALAALRDRLIELSIAGWVENEDDACDRDRIEFVGEHVPSLEEFREDEQCSQGDWSFNVHKLDKIVFN